MPSFKPKPKTFWERNFANAFLFVGIPMLVLSLYFAFSSYIFMQKSEKTTGKVVDYEYSTKNKPTNRTSVAPIIEYKTPDSQKHLFHHNVYSRPPMYKIGEEVTVYYNPQNFKEASLGFSWFIVGIFGGLGVVFTGFGFVFKKNLKKNF